jgi:hypothetical protein
MASGVHLFWRMSNHVFAMLVPGSADLPLLVDCASKLEWEVEPVCQPEFLRDSPAAGIFLQKEALGECSWIDAIETIRALAPSARIIVCHNFSEPIDWQELSEAGAFHAVALPLSENEVQQSLGFLWAAENRGDADSGPESEAPRARRPERRAHRAWAHARHADVRAVR